MSTVANTNKLTEAQNNFKVVPMARVVPYYEKNLQKIFSEDKITLKGVSYDLLAFQKKIGDFEVASLINRQLL